MSFVVSRKLFIRKCTVNASTCSSSFRDSGIATSPAGISDTAVAKPTKPRRQQGLRVQQMPMNDSLRVSMINEIIDQIVIINRLELM